MIKVHELLRTKEDELGRVRREIEALRTVAPLLVEPDDMPDVPPTSDPHPSAFPLDASSVEENAVEGTSPDSNDVLFHSISPKRSRVRNWLGRAVGE
jgi:hypothetical protein